MQYRQGHNAQRHRKHTQSFVLQGGASTSHSISARDVFFFAGRPTILAWKPCGTTYISATFQALQSEWPKTHDSSHGPKRRSPGATVGRDGDVQAVLLPVLFTSLKVKTVGSESAGWGLKGFGTVGIIRLRFGVVICIGFCSKSYKMDLL